MRFKVKRTVIRLIGFVFFISIFFMLQIQAKAEMKPRLIDLKTEKFNVIKEDVTGDGKQDKIEVKISKEGDEYYSLLLGINGDFLGPWNFSMVGTPSMLITDLDDSDGLKEFWFAEHWGGGFQILSVFHSGESFFSSLYDDNDYWLDEFWYLPLISEGTALISKGDGTIRFESEYGTRYLGNYYYEAELELTEDGLKIAGNKKSHKTTDEWRNDRPYKLTTGIKVYSKFKGKQQKFSLKKGDVFYIHEVRYTSVKISKEGSKYLYNPWAYIVTEDGRKGWIKIPKKNFYKSPDGYRYEWG